VGDGLAGLQAVRARAPSPASRRTTVAINRTSVARLSFLNGSKTTTPFIHPIPLRQVLCPIHTWISLCRRRLSSAARQEDPPRLALAPFGHYPNLREGIAVFTGEEKADLSGRGGGGLRAWRIARSSSSRPPRSSFTISENPHKKPDDVRPDWSIGQAPLPQVEGLRPASVEVVRRPTGGRLHRAVWRD